MRWSGAGSNLHETLAGYLGFGESAPGLSMGNTFNKNKSFDNNTLADPFTYDFRDSTGPGPSNVGTKNTWTGNKGGTANPSAILTS